MKSFRRLALEEQLEVEKLRDAQKASYSGGEATVLYDNIKSQRDAEEQSKADKESSGEVPPEEDMSADQSDDAEPVAETDVAVEEIRNLSYAKEDLTDTWETLTDVAVTGGSAILGAIQYLTALGIEHGPKIVQNLYKGVTYVLVKTAQLLFSSMSATEKYLSRRINSFDNLKKSIKSYREALELAKDGDGASEVEVKYENVKVINSLKIGDNTNFTENIATLKGFIQKVIHGIDKQIANDIAAIKHLIAMQQMGTVKVPTKLTQVSPVFSGFVQGTIPGYPESGDFTETYKCNEVMPSDVVLMARLPKPDLVAIEEISKAYSDSQLSLGFDSSSFKEVSSVDYMSAQDLSKFLDELEELCDACIAHQALYERVLQVKKTLKFTLRGYVSHLASSSNKVSLSNSLAEYVYLKSMFVDKVYLVAAMDIHDYSAKVISFGLSFVKDNIKKLA